jgi:hypothetical protein
MIKKLRISIHLYHYSPSFKGNQLENTRFFN